MQTQSAELYSRGRYRLDQDRKRDGSLRTPFYQIVWYDKSIRQNRNRSTGTDSVREAELALDRYYLQQERGETICPTCSRPFENFWGFLLAKAISDYLIARDKRASINALKPRLAHVLQFMVQSGYEGIVCDEVDDKFIEQFLEWSAKQPVIESKHELGTTEASVRTLAAAINLACKEKKTLFQASFKVRTPYAVNITPTYRSSIEKLAATFRYCLFPASPSGHIWSAKMVERQKLYRHSLLRFLQISVATWCRPDAAHDFSTIQQRGQWMSGARIVRLNPHGRLQTKKYRPSVPVVEKVGVLIDQTEGFFVPVQSVRKAFEAMLKELGLPRQRETGLKLIRRSIAQIARKHIGEERWRQGEIMLGHVRTSSSDLYALFDPANLGIALKVTGEIIDAIEVLALSAFSSTVAGVAPEIQNDETKKNCCKVI